MASERDQGRANLSEKMQAELDRRLFHLKTLYDVSHQLLGVAEVEMLLKNFLMMTTGNFGVVEGFIYTQNLNSREIEHMVSLGLEEEVCSALANGSGQISVKGNPGAVMIGDEARQRLGFLPLNIDCALAFGVDENCSGLLGLGSKLVGEPYTKDDRDLLETLVNSLVVALKNARVSEALKEAYDEVSSLNKAKDKVIDHLSHELKTPVSLLMASLGLLKKKLSSVPTELWERTMGRAERNLERLVEMQYEVEDIMQDKEYKIHHVLNRLLDQCAEELEVLTAEQVGEGPVVETIRNRIEKIFGPKESPLEEIRLEGFVGRKIEEIRQRLSNRRLNLLTDLQVNTTVQMPVDPLEKIIVGLVKNAVENTPDEGKIDIFVRKNGIGVEFVVQDTGIGITKEHRKRIFEGFFPTQETYTYGTGKPYEFNAGGRGADLLRMKIFSERFRFKLEMNSTRCRFLPEVDGECPGQISRCGFCVSPEDCYYSGGTTFRVLFPRRLEHGKER